MKQRICGILLGAICSTVLFAARGPELPRKNLFARPIDEANLAEVMKLVNETAGFPMAEVSGTIVTKRMGMGTNFVELHLVMLPRATSSRMVP